MSIKMKLCRMKIWICGSVIFNAAAIMICKICWKFDESAYHTISMQNNTEKKGKEQHSTTLTNTFIYITIISTWRGSVHDFLIMSSCAVQKHIVHFHFEFLLRLKANSIKINNIKLITELRLSHANAQIFQRNIRLTFHYYIYIHTVENRVHYDNNKMGALSFTVVADNTSLVMFCCSSFNHDLVNIIKCTATKKILLIDSF